MKRVFAILVLFFSILLVPAAASAALKPDDDPTIMEGLRDKGVDWLKDKAKEAGKDWIFSTGQSDTMHEILLKARERADGEGNDKKGLCQYAVMGKASSILNDINTKWTVKTAGLLAFDTTVKMASLASGFGAAAGEGNALNWLMQQYTDAAKDAGKDAVFDKIKELLGKEEKPEFELYETSGKNGDCDYTLRAVWDIVHGTYRVYIEGDCHCTKVGQFGLEPTPLGKWWISFEGHLTLVVDKDKGTATWIPGSASMDFDAQCACSNRELRKAFVNVKPQTSVATGGGAGKPSGPPPLPPAGRKVCKECQQIQDEIDADHKALQDAQSQVRDLAGELAGAQNRLAYAKQHPSASSAKDIEEAEADIKRIKAQSARLETEQVRLMEALRDLARQLEECLKKNCQEGKTSTGQPPTETPPIAPENKKKGVSYESNPFASRILDVHNAERVAVGAPLLRWDPRLASDATAWATQLARTGQLAHAPREGRGLERENLSEGNLWWTADQMMNNWLAEKRYFHPGFFPNVCAGEWTLCAHYSQMIWPTTTDIGCGEASGSGHRWLVCRYSPGGNKDGKPVGLFAGHATSVVRPHATYQWIDVKTGKPVPSGPIVGQIDVNGSEPQPAGGPGYRKYHPGLGRTGKYVQVAVLPDRSDPNRAFDPESGRNFVRDPAAGQWTDAKTGKPVPSGPIVGQIDVNSSEPQPAGGPGYRKYHAGLGRTGEYVQVAVLPDRSDPNRAFDPESGRNFAKEPVTPKQPYVPERG